MFSFVTYVHSAQNRGGRKEQEDWVEIFRDEECDETLMVVADGVGGQTGGQHAARIVVEVARELWTDTDRTSGREFLEQLSRRSHRWIQKHSERTGDRARSTIVAIFVSGTKACWVHCGDSRLLRFRRGELEERTRDHSVVQLLLEKGLTTDEEMGAHPDQGRLLTALGGEDEPKPEFGEAEIEARDSFVLCTDGFWENISPQEISALVWPVRNAADDLEAVVARAAERGGREGDNVTAALLQFDRPHPAMKSFKSSRFVMVLVILFFVLVLFYLSVVLVQEGIISPGGGPEKEGVNSLK